jgi:hypothetical protein
MDEEKNELVFYDGRLMPLSQALVFGQEDAKWHQDWQASHAAKTAVSCKPAPGTEWDCQKLDLNQRFKAFWAEADAKIAQVQAEQAAKRAELKVLGFEEPIENLDLNQLPSGVFSFKQAVAQEWCQDHKTERWLRKFLQRFGYPKELLARQIITKTAYDLFTTKKRDAKRASDAKRKQVLRARNKSQSQTSGAQRTDRRRPKGNCLRTA